MSTVAVAEAFTSIQGESSYAGLSCFFIRLAGCNLRCRYCDTPAAREKGADRSIVDLVTEAGHSTARIVEITGGEPLLQPATLELATALRDGAGRQVLIESNGSRDISAVPDGVVVILDVKSPGSGEGDSFDLDNLRRLRPGDEIKFVLCDRADYEWAGAFVRNHDLAAGGRKVFFSPAWGVLASEQLAEWLTADGLDVHLQLQLHKVLGVR